MKHSNEWDCPQSFFYTFFLPNSFKRKTSSPFLRVKGQQCSISTPFRSGLYVIVASFGFEPWCAAFGMSARLHTCRYCKAHLTLLVVAVRANCTCCCM